MENVPRVLVCGVDEAGRGPLAGPVYAAAVILNPERRINGLADSKILPPERREVLANRIKDRAIAWAVASASVEEIDRLNIFHASMLAMRRAIAALGVAPEEAWIDGKSCPPGLSCRSKAIVDGDALEPAISAASILAKTERDAHMCTLHERYPHYGFHRHKGYTTPEHLNHLGRIGPCDIHRRSFYAVGVFSDRERFSAPWQIMPEPLRVRSYRLYCDAMKLAIGTALLKIAPGEPRLSRFRENEKRLRLQYADVLAAAEAAAHIDLVESALRGARRELLRLARR